MMYIRHLYRKKTTAYTVFTLYTGLMMLFIVAGCAQNFGRIQWDDNVTQAFESNQVEPNYNFYQYTIGTQVYAIVGFDPKLEMQSRIWRELSADTEDFEVATSRIWDDDRRLPRGPRGAIIKDPAGEQVGVYFSSLKFVSIKFQPENRVMVMLDTTPITGGPGERRQF
jgi:hypothetical protein